MKCECVKDIETRIAAHMRPQAGDDAKAVCQATGIVINAEMDLVGVLNIPFKITGSKKGFTSAKGKEMPCTANYCPFCGRSTKRYVVGEDAALAVTVRSAA